MANEKKSPLPPTAQAGQQIPLQDLSPEIQQEVLTLGNTIKLLRRVSGLTGEEAFALVDTVSYHQKRLESMIMADLAKRANMQKLEAVKTEAPAAPEEAAKN